MDFRISICLNSFFADERSFCYIYLENKKYERISNLEHHLNQIFEIPGDFCLMIGKHLLPSSESIRILKPEDIITVAKSKFTKLNQKGYENSGDKEVEVEIFKEADESADKCDKSSKKKKKKKTKRSTDEDDAIADSGFNTKAEEETEGLQSEVNEDDLSKDAEKDSTMESLSYDYQPRLETTNRPSDMSVNTKYLSGEETNNSDHEDMPLDVDGLEHMIIKRIEELKKSSLVSGDKLKQINETSSGRINKRKRIRKRKKGNNIMQNIVPDVKNAMPTMQSSLLMKPGSKISNHIRFDEPEKTVVQNGLGSRSVEKPRIIHAIESLSNNFISETNQSKEQNLEDNCANTDIVPLTNGESKLLENSVKQILPILNKYSILESLPIKGVILFKMLTMADNYLPKVSDYILGRIMESHKDTNTLQMHIIDGHKECQKPTGKFDLEEKTIVDSDDVEIEWSQVCEARFICS